MILLVFMDFGGFGAIDQFMKGLRRLSEGGTPLYARFACTPRLFAPAFLCDPSSPPCLRLHSTGPSTGLLNDTPPPLTPQLAWPLGTSEFVLPTILRNFSKSVEKYFCRFLVGTTVKSRR